MNKSAWLLTTLFVAVLVGCEQGTAPSSYVDSSAPTILPTPRVSDARLLQTGQTLFNDKCARCHGERAEGAREWRKADDDGRFPPPPLNGTGHAWHHPSEVLMEVIMDGSLGDGNMPAWRGKLTDDEVRAVIAWFQSLWSDDVYAVWSDLDVRYRQETQ